MRSWLSAIFFVVALESPQARGDERALEQLRALPYISWTHKIADRSLAGVVHHDKKRAFQGVNVHTDDALTVFLRDMEGREIHQWRVPRGPQCEYAHVMQGGAILVVCFRHALFKLDFDSKVLWSYRAPVSHDVAVDGDTIIVVSESMHEYRGRRVFFHELDFLSLDGKRIGRWSPFDHLSEISRYHSPSPLDTPPENSEPRREFYYHHINSVQMLPQTQLGLRDKRFQAGNILVCMRNVNLVVILDKSSMRIVWSWGTKELDQPHMPRMLQNGNILIFDNGTHRGWSRILEVDPLERNVIWEYRADPPEHFFSMWRGSSQRLSNGNTLITESGRGRAFEVTNEGEVVWEFWNPIFRDSGRRRQIYRLLRLSDDRIGDLPLLQ